MAGGELVGHPFEVAQHQRRAEPFGQAAELFVEHAVQLPAVRVVVGRWLRQRGARLFSLIPPPAIVRLALPQSPVAMLGSVLIWAVKLIAPDSVPRNATLAVTMPWTESVVVTY